MANAMDLLREQQERVPERSAPWMVAEQLMDICRREPECAALLEKDLQNKGMGIADAERKIKAFADAHKTGSFACVTPAEAENILREFYGLPRQGEAPAGGTNAKEGVAIRLEDFF